MVKLIRPEEAWRRIAESLERLPVESVRRQEAVGRVLAAPVAATVDVPALDVSAMDGFALAGEIEPGRRLTVRGTIAAGDAPGARLEAGAALRIMTGAPVPRGADRVVPVEQIEPLSDTEIRIDSAVPADAHIRRQGEVLRSGMTLLPADNTLGPGAIGLLATHGYRQVEVYRRPRVAVLATGNEVVPPETEPELGQLRDSNTDFLLAAGRTLGCSFESLGIVGDDRDSLRSSIEQGLAYDVLLVGGGVSMGDFDYVEDVLVELGCVRLFESVAVQPGKPLVVARHAGGLVFGLPGNPASVMVGFWLFVRPALHRLQGIRDGFWSGSLTGELAAPLPGAKGRDRFLSATLQFEQGRLLVTPQIAKGSHDLAAFARGSALVRVRAHAEPAQPGEICEILPLVDWPGA